MDHFVLQQTAPQLRGIGRDWGWFAAPFSTAVASTAVASTASASVRRRDVRDAWRDGSFHGLD